jgi:hypothetical protein
MAGSLTMEVMAKQICASTNGITTQPIGEFLSFLGSFLDVQIYNMGSGGDGGFTLIWAFERV